MFIIIISFKLWLYYIILIQSVFKFFLVDNCSIFDVEWIKPFEENQKIHPTKKAEENDESSNDFAKEYDNLSKVNSICTFDEDSKTHMEDTKDDREFHFDIICVCKSVFGLSPNEILSDSSCTVWAVSIEYEFSFNRFSCLVKTWVPNILIFLIASWEKTQWNRKEFIVDKSTISSKETHE